MLGISLQEVLDRLKKLLPRIEVKADREYVRNLTVDHLKDKELCFDSWGRALPYIAYVLKFQDPRADAVCDVTDWERATLAMFFIGEDSFSRDLPP